MRQWYLATSILALAASLGLSSGCTQVVHVSHSDFDKESNLAELTDGIATKVLIQPPAIGNQKVHVQTGLLVVGMVNSWEVDLNQTLPDAMHAVISQTYDDVTIGHSCDDCGLIVRPKITQVEVEKLTMQASVELEIGVHDAYGREITKIRAGGDSAFMDSIRLGTGVAGYFVPLLGTALGTTVVGETVKDALDEALVNASEQLSNEANSGVLARTWLPKASTTNKKVGKHQYTAELVAKSAGCNLNSDDLRLSEEHYYTETYTAQCWGKPAFAITCEFGRCELDESAQGLAQTGR